MFSCIQHFVCCWLYISVLQNCFCQKSFAEALYSYTRKVAFVQWRVQTFRFGGHEVPRSSAAGARIEAPRAPRGLGLGRGLWPLPRFLPFSPAFCQPHLFTIFLALSYCFLAPLNQNIHASTRDESYLLGLLVHFIRCVGVFQCDRPRRIVVQVVAMRNAVV